MTSDGATIKTSALEAEAGGAALSVTVTVKLYVPAVVGVPVRHPLLASSVRFCALCYTCSVVLTPFHVRA